MGGPEERSIEFLKDAIHELYRHERNWDYYDKETKRRLGMTRTELRAKLQYYRKRLEELEKKK